MFVPFLSKRGDHELQRRKGGGKSSSSGSSSGGKSSSSSGKSSGTTGSSSGSNKSVPISTGSGKSKTATSYGFGGGKITTIPSGQLFAGRSQGGGTRTQVYGNRQYGSGYPGLTGRGVQGRGFPFIFWPLVWVGIAGVSTETYLHQSSEYGLPNNSSRPGGAMMTVVFPSPSLNSTFRVIADNSTIQSLITDIAANCSSSLGTHSAFIPAAYNDTSISPKPEQTVQYYRASSVALTLDNYNNTSVLDAEGTPDAPLPSPIDNSLLDCLNYTIGEAVPLINGTSSSRYVGVSGICLIFLVQVLIKLFGSFL